MRYGFVVWLSFLKFIICEAEVCSLVIDADVAEYSGVLESRKVGCLIKILPNSTHATRISLSPPYDMGVKMTAVLKSGEVSLYTDVYKRDTPSVIIAPAGTHLFMFFGYDGSSFYYNNLQSNFHLIRFIEEEPKCGMVEQTIESDLQTVQSSGSMTVSKSCYYHLSPKNVGKETLVLFIERSDGSNTFLLTENKKNLITTNFLKIDNWKSVDLFVTYESLNPGQIATITAVSVEKECKCGPLNYTLSSNTTSVTIRTPSLLKYACPSMFCVSGISMDPEIQTDGTKFLVTTKAVQSDEMSLTFASKTITFKLSGIFPPAFLLDSSTFKLAYNVPQILTNGSIEVGIQAVNISEECECSTFFTKQYKTDYKFKIRIPASCNLMFCHWNAHIVNTIQGNNYYYVEVSLKDGGEKDTVEVFGNNLYETYNNEQLKWPRALHVSQSASANIAFWRRGNGPNATLEVSWKVVEVANAHSSKSFNLTTNSITTVLSPYYPYQHRETLDLIYEFHGPKNSTAHIHFDEVNIERTLDHITVYDGPIGNSTEIHYSTGENNNITVVSSGESIYMRIVSDGHISGRGFHLNAFSVPNERVPARIDNRLASPKVSSPPTHPFLTFFVIIAVVTLAIGLYLQEKKQIGLSQLKSWKNKLILFRSREDSESVTISP